MNVILSTTLNVFPKLSAQDITALGFDAVQVINQAINLEPCLSINGSFISANDKEAMLTCLKKVSVMYYKLFPENV